MNVVTRFAPSPTGFLHLGAYRTAIFAYLFARKHGGKFILRIEDTDRERNKKEYEEDIMASLKWLSLEHDVFYRQSEHVARHREVLLKMIENGFAYISKEAAKDGSGVIKEIVRFKNPNIDVSFEDEVKGTVTMNTEDLGDFVLAKNINEPLFHLAVVVDDFDAGVTHVIRGEDHTSNTPRQILIQRAIGAPTPVYAHLPLVLGEDKLKLSKRRGALPIMEYKKLGYLPDAILNGVAFVGWNPGTEQEIFSHDELVSVFDLKRVNKSAAIFNTDKLKWFNKEHMTKLSDDAQTAYIRAFLNETCSAKIDDALLAKLRAMIIERIEIFSEVTAMCNEGELDYFFDRPAVLDVETLVMQAGRHESRPKEDGFKAVTKEVLEEVVERLSTLPEESFDAERVKAALWDFSSDVGRGSVLWPLRYLLSGKDKSPDPFTIAAALGKEETLARVHAALALIS